MKEKMSSLTFAVNEFNRLGEKMGYETNPPYTGPIPLCDFGRGIVQKTAFWQQYGELLRISNGLFADGHTFYGLTTGCNEPGLIEFNTVLNTQGFEFESMKGRIVIGENNTDTLYYDTLTGKWESCDRIGTENVWESCKTLAELLETQIAMLKESHPDIA